MQKAFFVIIVVLSIVLVICTGCKRMKKENDSNESKIEYIKKSADEAKMLMDESQDYIILDVRTEAEFAEGHIEGALLLPNNEIRSKAEELLPDKNQLILVYCRSGNRSASAAKDLIKLGYTNVIDFGGIIDWPYGTVK